MLRSMVLVTLVVSSILAFADQNRVVDCGQGQSLTRTLASLDKSEPATVRFKGICTEYVVIDGFDNLTLKGMSNAAIQQPAFDPPRGPIDFDP